MRRLKKKFPSMVDRKVRRCKKNVLVLTKVYKNWGLDDINNVNEGRIKGGKNPKFVIFPNYEGRLTPKIEEGRVKKDLVLLAVNKMGRYYFLNNHMDYRVDKEVIASIPVFEYKGIVGNRFCKIFSINKMDVNHDFSFKGIRFEIVSKRDKGESVVESKYIVLWNRLLWRDYSEIKKLRFKTIHDLSLVWDFKNNSFIWDDIETALILCNAFYCCLEVPAMNMVLCGETEAKKTPWISMFSRIFKDLEFNSASFTSKSLIPSFYGKEPKLGVLLESNFITLLDDWLRFYDQQAMSKSMNPYTVLKNGLAQIFNILDRVRRNFPSGKFDVTGQYNASFFATDNMKYQTEVKKLWETDKAVLRRFSFLKASPETEERGSKVRITTKRAVELLEERMKGFGLDFKNYRLLGYYIRSRMNVVKLNKKEEGKIDDLADRVEKFYSQDFHMLPKIEAIFRFCKIIKKFIPSWSDIMFEKMVWRLAEDFNKLTT